ncbi:MAG TPA: aspartate aminotransferase family protein [Rhodothermales bacterium]|nr:aspartate aminotransferase family protein [Rhodothermales bacterium]HRR07308.1 aspartate aminotransferase family protein [Rhodothermales bacterium]
MPTIQLKTAIPGPLSRTILERRAAAFPNGLAKSTEVVVAKAHGAIVEDVDGNILIDFAGGIGMQNAGHCPPSVVRAIQEQAEKYIHPGLLVTTFEPAIELAEMLNKLAPMKGPNKTLLSSSGAEALEYAVNIAKYYTKRQGIIVFEGAYHGRTLLTMSLTSKYNLFKRGYGAMVGDIYRMYAPNPYRRPAELSEDRYIDWAIRRFEDALVSHVDPSAVAAILIEPVQGEAGFVPVQPRFMQYLREVADKHGIVLIADEVQAGSGRTGKLFSIEHTGVEPDIVTVAKSVGAGMPLSAVIGKAEIMDSPHLGAVGGTYSGAPLAAVAGIETLKILTNEAFVAHGNRVAEIMEEVLSTWVGRFPLVGAARGLGAMRLVEFVKDRETKAPDPDLTLEIIKDASAQGLILIRAGLFSNGIRFLPPMVISEEDLREGFAILEGAIERAHEKRGISIGGAV